MKIVIIGTTHPFRGGLASFNERLALELVREGHEVEVYTFTLQYPSFLFPGKTQYSEEPAPKEIKISRKINSVNPLNWIKVGQELRKNSPDLILIKYWLPFMAPCFGTILRRVKKNRKTKVISILDNIIPHEKRMGDEALTRYFVQPIDGFIGMSQQVMNDLTHFDAYKPSLQNPHPIFDNFGKQVSKSDAATFLKLDETEKYLLFFGFIRDYKGLDWLLEAFEQSNCRDKVKLLIAGEFYANEEKYLRLIAKLHLEDRVILRNHFINDSEVKYYFSLANLLVQPYKDATQSGVTQIAYQFDCPMIVTNVGGLADMVPNEKIGFVVEPDIASIQKAIDRYFNEDLEGVFRNNFEVEKQKYSWSMLTQSIFTLLNKIKG